MNIEPLKKIIQAANPEIMELKFGCEVKGKTWGLPAVCVGTLHGITYALYSEKGKAKLIEVLDDMFESFGRPIRLADVLVTLASTTGFDVWPSSQGNFTYCYIGHRDGDYGQWNLLHDNLDHQSDECKQFLTDLLV